MTLKERAEISKRQNYEAFKDIYEYCEKYGCDKNFVNTFRARIFISPMPQTRAFIESVERNYKYSFDPIGKLKKWRVFLLALVELLPDHEKAKEWKESLKILEDEMKSRKVAGRKMRK